MSVYSIKDLEVVSGIKAHTIRIWEQRYGLLEPKRTETNIRFYDDYQLCKLINVSTLIENGYKVSKIASFSEEEISKQVDEIIEGLDDSNSKVIALVNHLINSGLTYNEQEFTEAFNYSIEKFGLVDTFLKVIYPMLVRIGLMWNKQDIIPSQEHFISNLIKQKLFKAIDDLPEADKNAERWILLLPEEEDHEIGLVLSYYLLKLNGKKVFYLGQRVPFTSIQAAIEEIKPGGLHFFMVKNQSKIKAQKFIDKLNPVSKNVKSFVSGSKSVLSNLKLPSHIKQVEDIENFLRIF